MNELKKAQSEYLRRLSDPSYIAPDILRSRRASVASRINENPGNAQDYNPKDNVSVVRAEEIGQSGYLNQVRKANNSDDGYRQELARSLGIEMKNGVPVLSPEHENFMNKSIDKSVEGLDLTEQERNIINLMVDPDWEK